MANPVDQSGQTKSGYQKVQEFHDAFGHPNPNDVQRNIFDENPALIQSRISLILEELNETKEAYANHDAVEFIDGLCDMLYVIYGMGIVCGLHNEPVNRLPTVQLIDRTINQLLSRNIIKNDDQYVVIRLCGIERSFEIMLDSVKRKDINCLDSDLAVMASQLNNIGKYLNIPLNQAFDIVHQSNMSKLCSCERVAEETIAHYKTLPEFSSKNVRYRLAPGEIFNKDKEWLTKYVIYNADTGKILKSKYWHLPNFDSLFLAD